MRRQLGRPRRLTDLLNHCITRPINRTTDTGYFIDRYILKAWSANLVARWEECVREVGIGTANV
jgi:hypothetical protein